MRSLIFVGALVFFCNAAMAAESTNKSENKSLAKLARLSDQATKCGECHEDEVASFTKGFHAKTWANKAAQSEAACSSCHGDNIEEHMKTQSKKAIISFKKGSAQSPAEQNARCLACHEGTEKVAFWKSGPHAKNDLTCATCHDPHKDRKEMIPSSDKCLGCHKEIQNAVNKLSHHPIKEGKVTCIDCHNPHGTMNPKNLKAESVNLLCYKCHGDKRGPWLWEHPPVEENCLICHTPHGSVHPKLLNERAPGLCQNCHANTSHAAQPFSAPGMDVGSSGIQRFAGSGCLNCHNRIHGSMFPGNPTNSAVRGSRFFR